MKRIAMVLVTLLALVMLVASATVAESTGNVLGSGAEAATPTSNTDEPTADGSSLAGDRRLLDQVIADDLIVNGSGAGRLCVGFECVDGEIFGHEVLKLKKDWTQLLFEDTSDGSGFPTNDWRLQANDRSWKGEEYFALVDETHGTVPLRVDAEARTDALRVASNGRVGLGTGVPAYPLHVYRSSDYPQLVVDHAGQVRAMVAVSETQTMVGSLSDHPVVLMAGYDPASGETGAALTMDVSGTLTVTADLNPTMRLDANGNMVLSGALTEASDVNRKEHFQAVDGEQVLAALVELPISTWNYIGDDPSVRHLGPMAQDFYAAFGLGVDETHLAPLDVNGVTLVALQAQNHQIEDLAAENARLSADVGRLEQANADLQARLAQLEALVQASLAD